MKYRVIYKPQHLVLMPSYFIETQESLWGISYWNRLSEGYMTLEQAKQGISNLKKAGSPAEIIWEE